MPPKRNNPLVPAILFAAIVTASSAVPNETKAGPSEDAWQIVQSYVNNHGAWTERWTAISDAEIDVSEKQRRRAQLGPAPPSTPAIEAAKAVIQNGGDKAFEAVAFLLDHDEESAMLALTFLVGPDWSVIEDYIRATRRSKDDASAESPGGDIAADRASAPAPIVGIVRATAAANAILHLGHDQRNRLEAAEFLIESAEPRSAHLVDGFLYAYRAAEALSSLYPRYDEWPRRIHQLKAALGGRKSGDDFDSLNTFIAALATMAGDPAARASARYFTALLLLERADDEFGMFPLELRRAWQRRALELATGLSAGVADEKLAVAHAAVGTSEGRTYGDLEADLVDMIHSTTIGGNASSLAGRRLDGTVEPLSRYTDRLLLLDFWATWCGPCIKALPDLWAMARRFPDDLRILAVSVDEDVDTVREFLAETDVPWENWHVGQDSQFVRKWRIGGYPTYVLIDRGGEVLNRYTLSPLAAIEADIEKAIASQRNPSLVPRSP